ncbi:MAG: hypothetical protein JJU29_09985 [Verrucomicrobia bacterium]|nr:hypothetical protein [Verrucomicrobiota bacterium]MCH8512285.1 hypothetical protein [Kiritimatiellia bacterium]
MKKTLILFSFLSLCAQATMIQWFCDPTSLNLTEDGEVLNQSFRFELGVFANGFVPTSDNIDQWSENWVAAQRVTYHEGNQWFTSVYHVTENEAPFTVNAHAYVWGFSGGPDEGEWALFRGMSWRWPRASFNPSPRIWNAREANEVIMGSIGKDGELIRSARVHGKVPPTTTWAQWLAEEALEPSPEALLEYATGSENPTMNLSRNADGSMALSVPRRADRPADFLIEYSDDLYDLQGWKPAGSLARLVQETPTGLRFQPDFSEVDMNRIFFRFRVFPPEGQDTP